MLRRRLPWLGAASDALVAVQRIGGQLCMEGPVLQPAAAVRGGAGGEVGESLAVSDGGGAPRHPSTRLPSEPDSNGVTPAPPRSPTPPPPIPHTCAAGCR